MSSIFYININNHENTSNDHNSLQKIQDRNISRLNKLLIEPQKIVIIYQQEKTYVQKILIQSTFGKSVNFKVIQPKKSVLNVKYKKSLLNPKQTNEIFLFFNCQNQKSLIEDQFIIILDKQRFQLHVPITCRPKFRTSHRKLSLTKSLKNLQIGEIKNKEDQKKPKTKGLTLKRRPMTTKRQQFQSQMQIMVNNFIQRFSQIQQFVKEKNVKKQIFIGQKALSRQKHNKITKFNDEVNQYIVQKIRKKVQQRNKVQFSQQGPVVRNFQGIILRWSKEKNIPRIVYEKGLAKMQQKIRQYLIDLRFQKIHRIFSLYRQFQSSEQHNNLPHHKRHEIYVQKLQKRLNRKQQISLELNFDWSSVMCTRLQSQRETFRKVQFGINPRIGFDNWVPIQEGARYSHEVMRYEKKQPIPEWMCHPRIDKKDKQVQYSNEARMHDGAINQNDYQRSGNTILRQDDIHQMDFILDLVRIDRKKETKMIKGQSSNTGMGSRLELKNNSDQNKAFNKKSSSHTLSIRHIPSFQNRDQHKNDNKEESFLHKPLTSYFFNFPQKVFHPFVMERELNRSKSQQLMSSKEIEEFILSQISRNRYHLDYMNIISYSREQQPELQSYSQLKKIKQKYHSRYQHYYHPVNLIQSLLSPNHNSLIRKLSKQDKHQFDRLNDKALRILSLIDFYQKRKFIENYKLKNDVDLEINSKYRRRTYDTKRVQKEMQNLKVVKNDALGKAFLLQLNSYQAAKNKQLSIFLP